MSVNHIKSCLLALSVCLFLNLPVFGITVRQIPVAKELPSNTVYRMFQDRDGFVWFGTQNGFCRYDGYGMKSFRSENSAPVFPSNFITGGFTEDTLNNTLWIGTERGVWILDKWTHEITPLDTALLGESPIRQILCVDNAIWVCSDFGLYLYNKDKTLRKKYMNSASSIHIDRQGTIRVTAWREGMHYLDRSTDTFVPYPKIGQSDSPHKIFQDSAGRFWICTWGDGLFRFHPDRQGQNMYEHIEIPDDGKEDFGIFFGMEQDDVNGYLWVLSYAGVIVFNPDDNRMVPLNEFMSSVNELTNLFSDIIKDRDGNLWLGTYEQGAMLVNPNRSSLTNLDLQSIKTETGYVPNIIKVFEDREGELWIKQSRIGLFLLHLGKSAIRQLDIPDINAGNAICNHSETGEIWVAADYIPNIYRLKKSGGKVALTGRIDMRTILVENMPVVRFLHEDGNGVIGRRRITALFRTGRANGRLLTVIAEVSPASPKTAAGTSGLALPTTDCCRSCRTVIKRTQSVTTQKHALLRGIIFPTSAPMPTDICGFARMKNSCTNMTLPRSSLRIIHSRRILIIS
jgi:ligand-binding sensor domain-containing protein